MLLCRCIGNDLFGSFKGCYETGRFCSAERPQLFFEGLKQKLSVQALSVKDGNSFMARSIQCGGNGFCAKGFLHCHLSAQISRECKAFAGIRSDSLGRYNHCDYLRVTGGSMTEEKGLDGDSYV